MSHPIFFQSLLITGCIIYHHKKPSVSRIFYISSIALAAMKDQKCNYLTKATLLASIAQGIDDGRWREDPLHLTIPGICIIYTLANSLQKNLLCKEHFGSRRGKMMILLFASTISYYLAKYHAKALRESGITYRCY